ncbi:hypothetical protein DID76_02040 [Candidatus Marinamargulisbacteria bacterium SCGC AG-414-C22]|nr:hypothetical protein DID76_02040 [Candidatus Marinamargulisbacteria bacterium SCGC AG-414-C22]
MKKIKLLACIQDINALIVRYVEAELRDKAQRHIKYSHYEILRLLHIFKQLSMKELSLKINKHKSTVTALTKKLMKHEFVEINKDKKDERKQMLKLTQKGKKFAPIINSIEQKILININQNLHVIEQNSMLKNLNNMHENLKIKVG